MSVTAPGCASHVTVCAVAWKCHVMVDVPASLRTVTADGSNAKPVVAVTLPVADGVITASPCEPVCVTLPIVIDAEMVELPFATPVTRPVVALTVATVRSDEEHVTPVDPGKVAPFWSFAMADIAIVPL